MDNIGLIVITALIGLVVGYFIKQMLYQRSIQQNQMEADQIINDAKEKARIEEQQAKSSASKIRRDAEGEVDRRRREQNQEDQRLRKRRSDLDRQMSKLQKRENGLNQRTSSLDRKENDRTVLISAGDSPTNWLVP